MKGYFGIKVKDATMTRSVWLSPKGTTTKRIHASNWETVAEAQSVLDSITSDPRNSHIIGKVEKFS